MRYRIDEDPFEYKQPEIEFLDKLMGPVHTEKPVRWNKREAAADEVQLRKVRLCPDFPDEEGLLETVYTDFHDFCRCYELQETENGYPVRAAFVAGFAHESYRIAVTEQECRVEAGDTEGIRRGFYFLQDEMHRREGSFLPLGAIHRNALIHTRISRGYLNPHYNGVNQGELEDDTEYYSDDYLNRLAHDGVNGIWLQERFRAILPSKIFPGYGVGGEDRLRRLNELIARCARYGIKVWLECIEPASSYDNPELLEHPEVLGQDFGVGKSFCSSTQIGRDYIKESTRKLFELVPGLAGLVNITVGEAVASCAGAEVQEWDCPHCTALGRSRAQVLADCEQQLIDGMRAVNPKAEMISWVYGIRSWPQKDREEYYNIRSADTACMVNFEDFGKAVQLGKERMAQDYWLSYTGPGELFRKAAEVAGQRNTPLYAKLQICSSHEVSSVPYVPVPGILFDKYQYILDHGIQGVLYSWFFGNYPCMMNKAAGELAFTPRWESKEQFLEYLAGIYWGKDAGKAVRAYDLFAQGYSNFPICMSFEWYGTMTDAPAWPLHLEPVDLPVSRGWKVNGKNMVGCDRVGETFLYSFTYEEILQLCDTMREKWQQGVELLQQLDNCGEYQKTEQQWVAQALGILFDSGTNILYFYHLREQLGLQKRDGMQILQEMRALVAREMENSRCLAELCEKDKRLGYHCEAVGFKFFPEKLFWRIEELEKLLRTEFPAVEARIKAGETPLPFYYGRHPEGHRYVTEQTDVETAAWEQFVFEDGQPDPNTRVRMAETDDSFVLQVEARGDVSAVRLDPEFRMFVPYPPVKLQKGMPPVIVSARTYGFFGDLLVPELAKWHCAETEITGGTRWTLTLAKKDFFEAEVPFRLALTREGAEASKWEKGDRYYSRLIFGRFSPDSYVFVIPKRLKNL